MALSIIFLLIISTSIAQKQRQAGFHLHGTSHNRLQYTADINLKRGFEAFVIM